MCLAQGLNTVKPVRLEPAAHQSRVNHSTTEPLRSQAVTYDFGQCDILTSVDSDKAVQPPFKLRETPNAVQSVA